MFAFVISPSDVFTKDFAVVSVVEKRDNNLREKISVSDVGDSILTLLPFNTDKHELAPAIKDGWLYYMESRGWKCRYRNFPVAPGEGIGVSGSDKIEVQGKKCSRVQKNEYLNFSPDGKTVLLNTINTKRGSTDLYIGSTEAMGEMGKLEAFPYNSKQYSLGRGTLSPDGKLLVFSSNMPDSFGEFDLWMSRFENGQWLQPVNLGNYINTGLNEAMPYFITNTRLCFSSEGHAGYGGADLYYTDLEGGAFFLSSKYGQDCKQRSQ